MTRKSDALAKAVSALLPKFRASGSFLYHRNPILMVRGFSFDMPPSGCYIWKYYVPLFQNVDFLHMSLGYRIDNGFLSTAWKSTSQLAIEAVPIIMDNDDFAEEETLEELIQFSKDRRVAPTLRADLYRDLRIFESESLESIISRAITVRAKLGVD
ncbi:MAG TPA: hypothetical protein VF548_08530 [Allosphingosinicella sp.]